jgi:hypothetical protein
MNAQAFVELVRTMRVSQIAWYRDHHHSDLIEAKRLEKHVDLVLREGLDPEEPVEQVRQLDLLKEDDYE